MTRIDGCLTRLGGARRFCCFLRSLLAKRLRMRAVPHLHFFEDKSITEGMRISNLVSETIARDKERSNNDDEQE